MSSDLKKTEALLERESTLRVEMLRRVVRDYQQAVKDGSIDQTKRGRDIERAVIEYDRLHKARAPQAE